MVGVIISLFESRVAAGLDDEGVVAAEFLPGLFVGIENFAKPSKTISRTD